MIPTVPRRNRSTSTSSSSSPADAELLVRAREGESWATETLLLRYRNFARARANSYFPEVANSEDIIQEGMIGFFRAIRDFREDRMGSFRAFVKVCITRR